MEVNARERALKVGGGGEGEGEGEFFLDIHGSQKGHPKKLARII